MQRVFHARKHIIFRVIEQQTRRKAILKRQQLTCWHLIHCILPGACREVARLFLCTLPMVLETTMVLCPRSTLPPGQLPFASECPKCRACFIMLRSKGSQWFRGRQHLRRNMCVIQSCNVRCRGTVRKGRLACHFTKNLSSFDVRCRGRAEGGQLWHFAKTCPLVMSGVEEG